MVEFKEWPKIPRGGSQEVVTITEKIDGTNACIIIENGEIVGTQSRNHLLSHNNIDGVRRVYQDNAGFAAWVEAHAEELKLLGDGYHYGEWAGPGIQKNPHNLEKKTFFLFNSDRWRDGRAPRPACCECVPVLYEGPLTWGIPDEDPNIKINAIEWAMDSLWANAKVKGYHPEGVVTWFHKGRRYEKTTFENAAGKWAA